MLTFLQFDERNHNSVTKGSLSAARIWTSDSSRNGSDRPRTSINRRWKRRPQLWIRFSRPTPLLGGRRPGAAFRTPRPIQRYSRDVSRRLSSKDRKEAANYAFKPRALNLHSRSISSVQAGKFQKIRDRPWRALRGDGTIWKSLPSGQFIRRKESL